MGSNIEMKNTSLSLPEHEEHTKTKNIQHRNAVSSIKRLQEPVRVGRLSFKPIRLTTLTQEMLEAENEPLKKVVASDETKEDDEDDRNNFDDKFDNNEMVPNVLGISIESKKDDLGVSWLTTPSKSQSRVEFDNGISFVTPKINCTKSLTTPAAVTGSFVTPSTIKIVDDDKSASKLKIQCSIDVKGLLQTPVNSFAVKNTKGTCQSLLKLSTLQNTAPTFRNDNCDAVLNERSLSCNKSTRTVLKPSIKNLHSIVQEKNKENTKKITNNMVKFSLPATEINDTLKEIRVKNVRYAVLNQLGRGGSSVVYHCYDVNTKNERAIKKVDLYSNASAVGYINEVKVLERLQKCDRIIKMHDYEIVESEKLLLVVLERGGLDLSKILKDLSNANKHLPMHMLIFYWMEMLYAVKEIHDNGIVHSDLKPGNFLRAEGGLKLIDFGIASCVPDDMTSVIKDTQMGSFNYISPEALTNQPSNSCDSPSFGKPKFKVNYKSDVWSLGCILYQLVYQKTPFQCIGHMWAKLSAIVDPNHKIDYPEVDWVPLKIVNTIKQCLQYDMKARPTVDELIREYENIYN